MRRGTVLQHLAAGLGVILLGASLSGAPSYADAGGVPHEPAARPGSPPEPDAGDPPPHTDEAVSEVPPVAFETTTEPDAQALVEARRSPATQQPPQPKAAPEGAVEPVEEAEQRPAPRLVVDLSGPATAGAGLTSAYTITVTNTGDGPAEPFTLVHEPSDGQTAAGVSTPPSAADWSCVLGTTASCSWSGELAAGETTPPVTVEVLHDRRATGTLTSTARAGDARDSASTTLVVPEPSIDVRAPTTLAAGALLAATVALTNPGPGWANGLSVAVDLGGLAAEDLYGPGFDCDRLALRCSYGPALAPGATATAELFTRVPTGHSGSVELSASARPGTATDRASTQVLVSPRPAAAPLPAAPAARPAPVRTTAPRAVAAPAVPAPAKAAAGPMQAAPAPAFPTTLAFTGAETERRASAALWVVLLGGLLTWAGRRRAA